MANDTQQALTEREMRRRRYTHRIPLEALREIVATHCHRDDASVDELPRLSG